MAGRPPALLGALGLARTPQLRESFTRRVLRQGPEKPRLRDRFLAFNWKLFLRASFLLMVAAPTALVILYYLFIAAPTYTIETRFAIRTASDRPLIEGYLAGSELDSQPSAGSSAKAGARSAKPGQPQGAARTAAVQATGGGGAMSLRSRASAIAGSALAAVGRQDSPDPFIIANYVRSQDLVNTLDADGWLRARFAGGDPDWLQALPADASSERLARYWRSMVVSGNDINTNLVTVHVTAYTPEDTYQIAKRVVEQSEALINRMTERARRDRLRAAEQDLERAEENYLASEAALRELRTAEGRIDPATEGEQAYEQVLQLMTARIALDVQIRMAEPNLAPNAPQLRAMRERLAAIDAELEKAKARLTGDAPDAAANFLARFETLETERVLAATLYGMALDGLERTRLESERQATYLALFAPPYVPQAAERSGLIGGVLATFLTMFMLWGIFILTTAAGRDTLN